MKNLFFALIMLFPLCIWAQKQKMEGTAVGQNGWKVKVKHLSPLEKNYKGSFQGMDICNGLMLSLQDHGMATLYGFDGKRLDKKGMFKLESYDGVKETRNHANVAVFSNQYLNKGDKLPLVYVTRCNFTPYKGLNQVLYVEHVDAKKLTSKLVQVIAYDDKENPRPHSTQWVLDLENKFLYGYGNSYERENFNRHFVMKFKIPPYRGEQDSLVILTEGDLLEKYYMEDTYKQPSWMPVIQGATIKDNLLYLPMGVGRPNKPSVLYVWNLKKRVMEEEVNLQSIVPVEMEDCAFLGNKLIVQAQKNLFEFTIKKK